MLQLGRCVFMCGALQLVDICFHMSKFDLGKKVKELNS